MIDLRNGSCLVLQKTRMCCKYKCFVTVSCLKRIEQNVERIVQRHKTW